jgi:hypothetical protein
MHNHDDACPESQVITQVMTKVDTSLNAFEVLTATLIVLPIVATVPVGVQRS